MNNHLIKKEDLSIFDKIKAFFSNIFHKKISIEKSPEIYINNDNKQSNEFQNINTKERDLKEFIQKIEDNPDIIENLSNDRLDKLISYYEDITNSKKRKIEKLKTAIN